MEPVAELSGGFHPFGQAMPLGERPSLSSTTGRTLLDAGKLPVDQLADLGLRETRRPRPIYQAHRWFARRLGSAFRALLVGAATPAGRDFWEAYYGTADLTGWSVLDPFVGGGTSVFEAARLGADVLGIDIDPVACGIARFEVTAGKVAGLEEALADLHVRVGARLARYYRSGSRGTIRDVLHFFWVQVVRCGRCGHVGEAHPHFRLAYDAEGTRQWVFCPQCHRLVERHRDDVTFCCPGCRHRIAIDDDAPVRYGTYTCPRCTHAEALIDYARRTGRSPEWRLFALEMLEPPFARHPVPMRQRVFRMATESDRARYCSARRALEARRCADGSIPFVPRTAIPRRGRADDRLIDYQYRRYENLFNARQLLHLSLLAEAITAYPKRVREALALAFSDHLTTNCMLAAYAFGWRRCTPLFSLRAFRHVTRPVELNPWLAGTGRGTFPNTVRQVMQAIAFAAEPKEPLLDGGFRSVPRRTADAAPVVRPGDARDLGDVPTESIDLVLTDPPYFDNIAYSELSDFFLPWLRQLGVAPPATVRNIRSANLGAVRRDDEAAGAYEQGLRQAFTEIARVLRPAGRVVFTYQHRTAAAWVALGSALHGAGLQPIQLFPMLGDGTVGLHVHEGTSTWDAVFVLSRAEPSRAPLAVDRGQWRAALQHARRWDDRLRSSELFRRPDRENFARACVVAAGLCLFGPPRTIGTAIALAPALERLADEQATPPPGVAHRGSGAYGTDVLGGQE